MVWVQVTDSHRCEIPEDWRAMGPGSVWECTACDRQWVAGMGGLHLRPPKVIRWVGRLLGEDF
jgi:hypothetical protein